jgi:hypothetical protein
MRFVVVALKSPYFRFYFVYFSTLFARVFIAHAGPIWVANRELK